MNQTTQPVDPVFAGIAKALYGDVDPRELLAKFSPGGSDLHMDQPLDPKKQAQREKKLALTGMGATTVATVGGLHALSATRHENLQRMANAGSEKAKTKLAANEAKTTASAAARTARVANAKGPAGKVLRAVAANPKRAAVAAGTGWAALHGVELAGDALGLRANANSYNAAKKKQQQIGKAFRLKPLNSVAPKQPSLRAKRPSRNPPPLSAPGGALGAGTSLIRPVRKGVGGAILKPIKAAGAKVGQGLDALERPNKPLAIGLGATALGLGAATTHRYQQKSGQSGRAGAVAGRNMVVAQRGQSSQVFKAGKHSWEPPPPPGPVSFSNAGSGQTQANMAGAQAAAGKHREQPTPKLKPVSATPPPAATPPPKQSVPPPRAATPDPPPQVKTPPIGAKAPGVAGKIGADAKKVVNMKTLKPLGLIAGAAGAGVGVSSLLHRDKVNKGFVGNVRRAAANAEQATGHANKAAAAHADAAQKINDLIPSKKSLKRVAIGTAAGGSFAVGGAYGEGRAAGRRKERRLQQRRQPRLMAVPEPYVSKSVTWTGEIAKVDADKRQVFGWASVSEIGGKPVIDLQGDIVPIEEVEKSAYRYVIESRKGGDMHRRVSKADEPLHTSDLIESFVVTGEKLSKMGLAPNALPHGWWVGFKVNDDEQWNLVKSGHRAGFSIHGKGVRTPRDVSKSLDDVKDKAGRKVRQVKGSLKTRTDQALHPPAVKLKPVKGSTAVSEMGYQPQTRRLAYQLRSNPGAQYTYKVPVTEGVSALSAESKGRHYATKVARKAKRSDSVSPADRARLFIKPDVSKRGRS